MTLIALPLQIFIQIQSSIAINAINQNTLDFEIDNKRLLSANSKTIRIMNKFKKLILFLFFSEDVRELGFTVVIDMRGNSSWSTVKPILKVLQDYFGSAIHTAHIIKPDTFWQKQRTNLGSQKYKFEVRNY